jgi:hypothetical protein
LFIVHCSLSIRFMESWPIELKRDPAKRGWFYHEANEQLKKYGELADRSPRCPKARGREPCEGQRCCPQTELVLWDREANEQLNNMESWPSGPRQQFAKLRSRKGAHRFKSYTLRHKPHGVYGKPFQIWFAATPCVFCLPCTPCDAEATYMA